MAGLEEYIVVVVVAQLELTAAVQSERNIAE